MAVPAPTLIGKHVLVVDDHEDVLEIARTVLTYAGAEVTTCASPELALAALSSLPFDVVLTDLGFGGQPLAGTLVLESARQLPRPCVVIATTGRNEANLRRLGFDLVLVKPVDPFD